jgi:hypothetical protein
MHLQPGRTWGALIVYAAAVTFPHQKVQDVVAAIANAISHRRLYQLSAAIILILGVACSAIVWKRLAGQPARKLLATFWIVTLVLIWCTWRFGTANNVELVHYPQYVPEGMALLALTFSPAESLAWIALFGGLDECFQYWVLAAGKRVPFDFNDVYMDLLGGAAGVVLAMAFFYCDRRGAKSWKQILLRPGVMVILGIVTMGIVLALTGVMAIYAEPHSLGDHWFTMSRVRMPAFWFIVPANGPNKYHTLSPIEGPLLILATVALYAILDRRVNIDSLIRQSPGENHALNSS